MIPRWSGSWTSLKWYGNDPRGNALMIEIRRDVYMSRVGPGLDALAGALAHLVDAVAAAPQS
ncbi:hypothetical protein [Streptomyces sporangiiformans]|uniref:N-formylglutamate amidohydrolase n=1 Tax=Streptomyces sporangiiformans TaxID=2315329 RepID=A0A505DF94_9ACTN|nr:N-formylglutamate amidohydrolase [Streptomyces sporangiiformans]